MIGVLIFFVALALVCFLFRYFASSLFDKWNNVSKPVYEETADEDEELIAVISAAAAIAIKKSVVVRKIKFVGSHQDNAWSQGGRVTVMGSHSVPLTHK